MKHSTRKLSGRARLMAWTAAGVAGAGLLAGVANASTSSGSPAADTAAMSAASAPTAPNGARPQGRSRQQMQRRLAAASVRGEIVLDGKKGLQTVDFQRGTVGDASSSGFTVTDKSGTTEAWTITSGTKVRERTPGHGRGAQQGQGQDNGQDNGQGNGEGNASSAQLVNGENVVVIGSKSDGTLTARVVLVVPDAPRANSDVPQA